MLNRLKNNFKVPILNFIRGCITMVVNVLAKHGTRVRFPSPAPESNPRFWRGFDMRTNYAKLLTMFPSIFRKMKESIRRKVETDDSSLYVSMAFPILFAFILTFIGSRVIGYLITYDIIPHLYLELEPGLQVHHYTYGIFILFAAGYLALVAKQAREKFWIAMLLGFGLGLAMDEFGMWLKLRDDEIVRWSYDGFNITIGLFLFILTAKPGIKMLKKLWPNQKMPSLPRT